MTWDLGMLGSCVETENGPMSQSTGSLRDVKAQDVAEQLLAGVGTRIAHSAAVAAQAHRAAPLLPQPWRDALVDAAWLHDVGYAPQLVHARFHPLDGARWLRTSGWDEHVCRLVAGHSRALTEARLRGLDQDLIAEFDPVPELPAAALTWADLTSGSGGDRCSFKVRLAGIHDRYTHGPVRQAAEINEAAWRHDVSIIERLIDAAPHRTLESTSG